ncbi:hypothetical protein, partial [Undibacterium sp.]|uniref:hypothetical protein n=1 Tax=Undibacterium sp. TaxID=1914977 RepID=UPI0037512A6A
ASVVARSMEEVYLDSRMFTTKSIVLRCLFEGSNKNKCKNKWGQIKLNPSYTCTIEVNNRRQI